MGKAVADVLREEDGPGAFLCACLVTKATPHMTTTGYRAGVQVMDSGAEALGRFLAAVERDNPGFTLSVPSVTRLSDELIADIARLAATLSEQEAGRGR